MCLISYGIQVHAMLVQEPTRKMISRSKAAFHYTLFRNTSLKLVGNICWSIFWTQIIPDTVSEKSVDDSRGASLTDFEPKTRLSSRTDFGSQMLSFGRFSLQIWVASQPQATTSAVFLFMFAVIVSSAHTPSTTTTTTRPNPTPEP